MHEQYTRPRAERISEARTLLQTLKAKPCLDCGGSFPPRAMHFDHRDPSVKSHNVSKFATSGAITGMLAEIEKCDLVCANCHAARTDEQRRMGLIKSVRTRIDVAASRPGHRRLEIDQPRKALSIAMLPTPEPPPGYESLASAARRYGISDRTLRRRIESGELEAEKLPRPQGSVIYVKLPPGAELEPQAAPDGSAVSPSGEPQAADAASDTAMAPETLQDAPALTTRLLDKLDERDTAVAALTTENAALRERVGHAEARAEALLAELARERRPWWRRLLDG